jgi:hypothetical protein
MPNCPGNNYGQGILRPNPVPHTQTVTALRFHFRNWVMHGTPPPPSVWPRLKPPSTSKDDKHGHGHGHGKKGHGKKGHGKKGHGKPQPLLVDANQRAMGFPSIPASVVGAAWRPTLPEPGFINPVLDYDWGPLFDPSDASGIPTNAPPPIKRVIRMLVPRVDADGNELGGVPVVLNDAPLGTYLGWNVAAAGFHRGQLCNYVGGMIPFAITRAERLASGDPRLSLEERYGDHAGYVAAATAAAANAVSQGFLLQADADALIAQAAASNVLMP